MGDLPLTLACWDYDRSRPQMDGRVKPEGIDLDIKVLRPRETFPRMLDKQEFHVSEMSLASYVSLKGRGACPFVAIPVALSKIFRHGCIYVRPDAGIATPQDLKGKRVGTTQYGSTGLVFIKGMLAADYGVEAQDIQWIIGGLDAPTQPPLLPLSLPAAIKIDFLPAGKTLEASSMRCSRFISRRASGAARRISCGCSRTTRRSSRTTTGARRSSRSCTRW
jgi:4,5-dihydroxyphthalate decarboxylase